MTYANCIEFIKEPGLKLVTVSDIKLKLKNPNYSIPKRKILTADSIGIIMENEDGESIFLPYSSVHMIGRFKEDS